MKIEHTYKCINKIRNNSNKIIAYELESENGQRLNFYPSELRCILTNKPNAVTNLKLASNGRIIDNHKNNDKINKTNNIVISTHKIIDNYINKNNIKCKISVNRKEDTEYEIKLYRTMSDCDITIFSIDIEYDTDNDTYKIVYSKIIDLYKTYQFNDIKFKLTHTELNFSKDIKLDTKELNARTRVELKCAISSFKNLLRHIRYK